MAFGTDRHAAVRERLMRMVVSAARHWRLTRTTGAEERLCKALDALEEHEQTEPLRDLIPPPRAY